MENRNNIVRILAIVLLMTMLVSVFASCEGLIVSTGTTTTTTTKTKTEDPDQPHVCEFGPWELVEEATATKDGLSERKCEECGEVEQKVIPASVKEYTITYVDAPQHNNPTKYTVNDYVDLQKAVWNGLSFAYWTDKDGNIIEEIPYGTEGNITLYANWRLIQNIVISNNSNIIDFSIYSEESNRYYFGYKLGTMNNVVLDVLSSYKYTGGTSHTWSISETVSFTETDAQSIANTVSKSVTSSTSWSSTQSDATHNSSSSSTSKDKTISASIGKKDIAQISGSYTRSDSEGEESGSSNTTANSNSGSSGSSSGTSNTVSSTISFVVDTTTQVTRSEELNPTITPAGMYRYVQAGDIEVYIVVTYDIESGDYFTNIFSNIYRVFDIMIYEPLEEYDSNLRIVDSTPFKFDIDIDALAENINNAYYIEFDANGGTGSMPTQMMLPNTATELFENQFTKAGNAFVGWRVKGGDNTKIYLDKNEVTNLGSPKETVTLEAVWASTEPVWSEKETKVNYYAEMPSGFDHGHELYSKYNNKALESGIDGNTKIVVEETKLYTYIYWHWTAYRKAPYNRYIGKYQGEKFASGSVATYFAAFESNQNYGNIDKLGNTERSDIFYCNRGGDIDGSWWWYRMPVYVQTYTVYELVSD